MKDSVFYWSKLDEVKPLLDSGWIDHDTTMGWYKDPAGQTNVMFNGYILCMLAIKAGHGRITETDKTRAQKLVNALLYHSTLYTDPSNTTNYYTWDPTFDSTNSSQHWAVHFPAVQGLAWAYKYRTELGLTSQQQTDLIFTITKSDAKISGKLIQDENVHYYNQGDQGWQAGTFASLFIATGNSAYRDKTFTCWKNFSDRIISNNYLFSDFTWNYNSYWVFPNLEYALGTMCSMYYYPYIKDYDTLTELQWKRIQQFARQNIGMFTKAGHYNWDTPYGANRLYTSASTYANMRAVLTIANCPKVANFSNSNGIAKWFLDKTFDFGDLIDTWWSDADDGLPPASIYNLNFTDAYNVNKFAGVGYYLSSLALAVELGITEIAPVEPKMFWGWQWKRKTAYISNDVYESASIGNAPQGTEPAVGLITQSWGVSRIGSTVAKQLLTNIEGQGDSSFRMVVNCNGTTLLDTGVTPPDNHSLQAYPDLINFKPQSYDMTVLPMTADYINVKNSKQLTDYLVEAETNFCKDVIESTQKVIKTGTTASNGHVHFTVPTLEGAKIYYKDKNDVTTYLWDGIAAQVAGSPSPSICKYIHLVWESLGAGIIIVPLEGTVVSTGAKVEVIDGVISDTNNHPGKSVKITLLDGIDLNNVIFRNIYGITNGTDTDAETKYSLYSDENYLLSQKHPNTSVSKFVNNTKLPFSLNPIRRIYSTINLPLYQDNTLTTPDNSVTIIENQPNSITKYILDNITKPVFTKLCVIVKTQTTTNGPIISHVFTSDGITLQPDEAQPRTVNVDLTGILNIVSVDVYPITGMVN